jgi:hypothetical protein
MLGRTIRARFVCNAGHRGAILQEGVLFQFKTVRDSSRDSTTAAVGPPLCTGAKGCTAYVPCSPETGCLRRATSGECAKWTQPEIVYRHARPIYSSLTMRCVLTCPCRISIVAVLRRAKRERSPPMDRRSQEARDGKPRSGMHLRKETGL